MTATLASAPAPTTRTPTAPRPPQARTRPRNRLPATAPGPASSSDVLSAGDACRLAELEQVIDHGLGAFIATGNALERLRAERLSRASHPNWPAYLRDRFDLSEPRAHQLIDTARTAAALWPAGDPPARLREAAVRQFTPIRRELGDAAARDAWARVLEQHNGNPPAATEIKSTLAQLGLPVWGRAPSRDHLPRLHHLERLLGDAAARVERIAGHEQRFDRAELERLADAARDLAARLERLAQPAEPIEPMPDDYLCVRHGARRDHAGVCVHCRRPDLPHTA